VGEVVIGLAVPGRPIRSLVAEDRSAGGVRDPQDRPPRSVLGPWAHRDHRGERSAMGTTGNEEPQAGWPLAQAARTTPAAGSDCGPEGRGFESLTQLPQACGPCQ
jgi:hypothetical protein